MLNDIWEFDGIVWKQIAIFELVWPICGVAGGFYQIAGGFDHLVRIVEHPSLATLADDFEVLKLKRSMDRQHIKWRIQRIEDTRCELDRLATLFAKRKEDPELIESRQYFNPQVKRDLKIEIESLREEFVNVASKILAVHSEEFCELPDPPRSLCLERSRLLRYTHERAKWHHEMLRLQFEEEAALYHFINESVLTARSNNRGAGKAAEKTSEDLLVEKLDSLERERSQIAGLKRHLANQKTRMRKDHAILAELYSRIAAAEDAHKSSVEALELAKIDLQSVTLEKKRLEDVVTLLNKGESVSQEVLEAAMKRQEEVAGEMRELLKMFLSMEDRSSLTRIVQLLARVTNPVTSVDAGNAALYLETMDGILPGLTFGGKFQHDNLDVI
jgi:hypothetical protein